ncbi:MAG: sensor histidine kinase, partial [Acidimicrobiia bacterium]
VIVPEAPARIVTVQGVNLAFRGQVPDVEAIHTVPIERGDTRLATLEIWGDTAQFTPSQLSAIESTIAPVGLALDNDAMVQRLAGITIQRERVRLARELHDDVAPSIASVGLALDMVLMTDEVGTDQRRTLEATRSNVTRLVDRIRARVQDLRADRSVSIVEMVHGLVAEVDADGPTVVLELDERTPPRPAIAIEVASLLTEAFRNAITHANPTVITIGGRIDETSGHVLIQDNGTGFEVSNTQDGRYGLLGMQERAALIGATLDVASSPGDGTTVTLDWTERT